MSFTSNARAEHNTDDWWLQWSVYLPADEFMIVKGMQSFAFNSIRVYYKKYVNLYPIDVVYYRQWYEAQCLSVD